MNVSRKPYFALCCALLTALLVSSQGVAAQEPAAPVPPAGEPTQELISPAPAAELQRPLPVVPTAAEVAWRELHVLQDEEAELWSRRGAGSLGLPVTGIALGIPMLLI